MQPEAIITESPLKLMSTPSKSQQISIMIGYNSNEGLIMLPDALKIKKLQQLDKDLARMIPKSINLSVDDPLCQFVANEIRQFYFNGKTLSSDNANELADVMSDYHFVIGSHLTAELHARYQSR